MAEIVHSNNAVGLLASSITSASTSLVLQPGQGVLFPSTGSGDNFYLTIEDRALGKLEIVQCTGRTVDSFNIIRAQQGTTAKDFQSGVSVSNRVTAGFLNTFNSRIINAEDTAEAAATAAATAIVTANAASAAVAGKADLDSPTFTGNPTAPTQAPGDNDTSIATTAFVQAALGGGIGGYAPLDSPVFIGDPQAPTAAPGDNDTTIATTAFVQNAVSGGGGGFAPLASPTFTGDPKAPTPTAGDNDTSIATTAFVQAALAVGLAPLAPLSSPALTGSPTAPTAAPGTNTTQLATTEFVQAALPVGWAPLASPAFTGSPTAPTQPLATNNTMLATTAFVQAALPVGWAPLASPSFTGTPTAPTAAPGTNTTQLATTAFVMAATPTGLAPLASPTFTGDPKAPTPTAGDNDTSIATTAFVQTAVTPKAPLASPTFTGIPAAPTATFGTNTTQLATTEFVQAAVTGGGGGFAPLASPAFTGNPTAPTPSPGDNDTSIATTAFVAAADALKANLAGPTTFTGVTSGVTASPGTNSTQLATTAFVAAADALKANLAGPTTFTGVTSGVTASPGTNTTQFATTAFVAAGLTTALAPASLNPAMQTGFDALIASGGVPADAMSLSLNTLVNLAGSVPLVPATAAQMRSQPDGLYMVTPQAQREQWVTVSLTVSGGNCSIDGTTFQHGTVSAITDVAFTPASGLTQEPVVVDVTAVGTTRTVTAPGFDNKTNIGTVGIPIPSGVVGRFHMSSDGTLKTVRFIGYSDRGWAPEASTRLTYDANRLPVLLTATQEMTALMATSTFKAKNVAVVELALGTDFTSNITVADGKDYFTIPQTLNGWKLTRAQVTLVTAGTGGGPMLVQVHNKSSALDVLSTPVSIAAGALAGTVGTINASNNTATTDHVWRADVDAVHTTAAKGGILVMEFTEP